MGLGIEGLFSLSIMMLGDVRYVARLVVNFIYGAVRTKIVTTAPLKLYELSIIALSLILTNLPLLSTFVSFMVIEFEKIPSGRLERWRKLSRMS